MGDTNSVDESVCLANDMFGMWHVSDPGTENAAPLNAGIPRTAVAVPVYPVVLFCLVHPSISGLLL
jgi:hypothetical protein